MKYCQKVYNSSRIFIRSKKKFFLETIDFNYNPNKFYELIIIKPTLYKIPNVPYEQQYESRDFTSKSVANSPENSRKTIKTTKLLK